MPTKKNLTVGDLNKLYNEAESADREVFAEMRSNVLLVAGEAFSRRNQHWHERLRDTKNLSEAQRLRLSKNHIHKISRNYKSRILEFAPGVTILPKNELDLQCEKEAELNRLVWEDAEGKYKLKKKIQDWAAEFVDLGEVATKIFWDPSKGDFLGYAHAMHPETGEPQYDEQGNPVPDEEKPQFKGAFVFETVYGFNLFRPSSAKSMDEAPWLGIRKMVGTKELKDLYPDADKQKFITQSAQEDFIIFDANKGMYARTKDHTLVREIYYKPCADWPMGHYWIFTAEGILEDDDLPYGLFPICWEAFDVYPTAPRGRSILKIARPFQVEINRASSQMATHQVTLGDDKIIYQAGTKLAPGTLLPGVRGVTFQGIPPTVIPGRDGGQFLTYIEKNIEEMYDAVEMSEENQDEPANGALDPYTLLYTSLKQRKKYAGYGEKFERFLCSVTELYLQLAKKYLPDDELLAAIGKVEQVNIPEFRNPKKLLYQIKIEPQNDTLETQLGKQLSFNHVLQYVGGQLDKGEIGRIMRNMPFGNEEESFSSLTIDYDNAENEMLALERGELPQIQQYENHEYIAKAISARMKRADFKFLPPKVQQSYQAVLGQHEQILADQAQKLLDAKNELIPTNGAMVACDLYIPDPQNPQKAAKRVRVPYQALDWLVQKLEAQGTGLQQLENMNQGTMADIASKIHPSAQGASPQGMLSSAPQTPPTLPPHSPPMPQGGGMRPQGPASPQGIGVS